MPLKDWDPEACALPGPTQFNADGTFSDSLNEGSWRINGNELTEITTASSPEQMDWSPDDIGKPFRSTIHWVDENIFAQRYADGEIVVFRRCPDTH